MSTSPLPNYPTGTPPVVRKRRRWIHIIGYPVVALIGVGIGSASAGGGATTASAPTVTVTRDVPGPAVTVVKTVTVSAPAARTAAPAAPPARGVSVTGADAANYRVASFKAQADALGEFAPVLRIKNVTGDRQTFVSVKVTALKGAAVVAVADGVLETIGAGETVTFGPLSTDKWSTSKSAGVAYEVTFGNG